jgi:hypothetical protein
MNAVCLIVDGLHAGFLGCYGNGWIVTPEIDRLACNGFTFDHALIDSPSLEIRYRAYWHGEHALAGDQRRTAPGLAQRLREVGVRTALLTDEPALIGYNGAEAFDEAEVLPDGAMIVADDMEQTQLGQLTAAAGQWLASVRQPFLLWIHARGMAGRWDAPLELRRRYADDGAAVYMGATPPAGVFAVGHDPDERLALRWAYAGQISVLDQCVGALSGFICTAGLADATVFLVSSARGYALGEHLRFGTAAAESAAGSAALYEELVHVPWIMRVPGFEGGGRSQALVQPADLGATVADWLAAPPRECWSCRSALPVVREEMESLRDRACSVGPQGERAVRTAAWRLGWGPGAASQLYVKPDDRWEVNDVADRCGDLIEPLQRAWTDAEQAIADGAAPAPLPEELIVGPE